MLQPYNEMLCAIKMNEIDLFVRTDLKRGLHYNKKKKKLKGILNLLGFNF